MVFDDPEQWRELLAGRGRVVVFDDAARMAAGHLKRPWTGWEGRVRPDWVMIRGDKGGPRAGHGAVDVPVNYFRWLPWDMSVVATKDQYDRVAEVWVLANATVDTGWLRILGRAFPGRRVRYYGAGDGGESQRPISGPFDVFASVFAQKTVPEIVISLTHDQDFAPMKAWFAANGIPVREYAPYATPEAGDPIVALSLPRLSEFCAPPDEVTPQEVISPAWVGSGWRRFTAFLTEWAEGDAARRANV